MPSSSSTRPSSHHQCRSSHHHLRNSHNYHNASNRHRNHPSHPHLHHSQRRRRLLLLVLFPVIDLRARLLFRPRRPLKFCSHLPAHRLLHGCQPSLPLFLAGCYPLHHLLVRLSSASCRRKPPANPTSREPWLLALPQAHSMRRFSRLLTTRSHWPCCTWGRSRRERWTAICSLLTLRPNSMTAVPSRYFSSSSNSKPLRECRLGPRQCERCPVLLPLPYPTSP